jgi:hypothetical protein
MESDLIYSEKAIVSKIYTIRNQNVMIDRDLAELYGVSTKSLKQTARRNKERFPEDFMFEMTDDEFRNWRSQNVTSNSDLMGLRYAPFCFTEQGVTMLSCILRSPLAIEVNIRVVRIFSKFRQLALDHKDILIALEEIKSRLSDHDEKIDLVFQHLSLLLKENDEPRKVIGFSIGKSE